MQVGKWGNSLAVRLPAELVELLGLREGDDIDIRVAGDEAFEVHPATSRMKALAKLKTLGWVFPAGFKFDRDEANER